MSVRLTYNRFHVPTNQLTTDTVEFLSRLDALETINRWNQYNPGVWVYWL